MKKQFVFALSVIFVMGLFACRGECVRCEKSGEQSLTYCENDFPDHIAFKNQLTGLDSAGYVCYDK